MRIEGQESIADLFSMFHDGSILDCHREENCLVLVIEIQYLAERIDPGFEKFTVHLEGVNSIRFSPWPKDPQSKPIVLDTINDALASDLEISQAEVQDSKVAIACLQNAPQFDYCGGVLTFTATSARVTDESEQSYSIEELRSLAKSYWDELGKQA